MINLIIILSLLALVAAFLSSIALLMAWGISSVFPSFGFGNAAVFSLINVLIMVTLLMLLWYQNEDIKQNITEQYMNNQRRKNKKTTPGKKKIIDHLKENPVS